MAASQVSLSQYYRLPIAAVATRDEIGLLFSLRPLSLLLGLLLLFSPTILMATLSNP